MSDVIRATAYVRRVLRLRAMESGWKSRSPIAASTRSRVAGRAYADPLTTRETVATDTWARCAMSRIVMRPDEGPSAVSGRSRRAERRRDSSDLAGEPAVAL